MNLNVNNETAKLKSVILGIGDDIGKLHPINPMIRKHIKEGTLPTEAAIKQEIKTFETVLLSNGIDVLRPQNFKNIEQIFTRDIGFVIEDFFFIANMKHPERQVEIKGIRSIIDKHFDVSKVINLPKEALLEGGDVILLNNYIFIGLGERSNWEGVEFLKNFFPHKHVYGYELLVDEEDSERHVLHLDCIFQPIGVDEAIIFEEGFKEKPTELLNQFPEEKLIRVTQAQKNAMYPNVFSISPTKVVIEKGFTALKEILESRNYTVFEVNYSETSKLNGLLRCSTLPLQREATGSTYQLENTTKKEVQPMSLSN